MISSQVFSQLGFKGRGANATSGAIGGAVAGTMIMPGIGTAIGALVGAGIGALFGGKKKPSVELAMAGIGGEGEFQRLSQIHRGGLSRMGPGFEMGASGLSFGGLSLITDPDNKMKNEVGVAVINAIDDATKQLFSGVSDQFKGLRPEFQERLISPLNDLTRQFASEIEGAKFDGKDFEAELQEFLSKELPDKFKEIFSPVLDNLQAVAGPFIDAMNRLKGMLDSIAAEHADTIRSLENQRTRLTESLMTPAELFVKRRNTLDDVMSAFRGGNAREQILLVPQIQALIDEMFRLGPMDEVLGQDTPLVRQMHQDLFAILGEVTTATDAAYTSLEDEVSGQLDIAESQLEALVVASIAQENIQSVLEESQSTLERIEQLLMFGPGAGILDTAQSGLPFIPQTGPYMLHRGERVVPEYDNRSYIDAPINVNISGVNDPDALAVIIGDKIMDHIQEQAYYGRSSLVRDRRR